MEDRLNILEKKEERNKNIEVTLQNLTTETKEKEQYDRNRNLEINQMDWLPNENLKEIVQRVADNFNIKSYKPEQIEAAHRIPNRNRQKPSAVIIQFKHRDYRDAWLEHKKRIVTNDNMYRNGNRKRIYLNENMSPYYKSLFWKAKTFARENNIKYVWFRRGKIMMRRNEDEKEVKVIRSEEDLKLETPNQQEV